MKVVDLHPDDLLDKEARGELSVLERARLDAHLERCEVCRFEVEARLDFADELGDEEEAIESQRLLSLLEGLPVPAVVKVAAPQPAPTVTEEEHEEDLQAAGVPRPSTRPMRTRRTLRVALLVAAALLVGSAATAGIGTRVWAHVASALSLGSEEEHTTALNPPAPIATTHRAPAAAVSTELAVRPDPTQDPTPEPAIIPVSVTPNLAVTAAESPASLFDAATKARNAGDYGHAIALHKKLESTYPSSREAHASYATLGRLLLDRGDTSGALQAFDAYAAKGHGPMDEAALVGRATALERLGRNDEARMTWTQLLRDFPDTPYREHAESRLKGH